MKTQRSPLEPELLNLSSAAELLSMSPRGLLNLRDRGLIPYVVLSKRCVRYPRKALLEAMAARTVGGR